MKQKEWKLFKGSWISKKPVLPGVWEWKEGGHAVRARVTEGTTGHLREIWKLMPDANAATALSWLEDEKVRVRVGIVPETRPQTRFAEFAASLFETKVKVGEIRSAKGRQKWGDTLRHLISGTTGKTSKKFVPGFGEFFLDKILSVHVDAWKTGLAELIVAGDYAPTTINGWLAILRVVMKAAKRQFALPHLATEGVENFDLSEHDTYTEEEPNSLLPEEVGPFLAKVRELHPAHFAMTYLGVITGLRPSSLRPVRRRGAEADVLWDQQRIFVRRSHTVGDEVMRTTKQRRRYAIDLPPEAMAILEWHVKTQLTTEEQKESDLLFPSTTGGFRAPCVLNKPFDEVATELKLGKTITQSALRRTFNDLARHAAVPDLVTRSISGHLTPGMQRHYSTVSPVEQRAAVASVIRIVDRLPQRSGGEGRADGQDGGQGQAEVDRVTKKAGGS